MERIRNLNGYQKGILVVLLAMIVVFTILYPITTNRVGYLYNETILVPSEQNGATVYSGKISGKETTFTVSGNTVVLEHGDKTYGPYTVTEDPAAVPEEDEFADRMTGIDIRCGDEITFRGGMMDFGNDRWLTNADGTPEGFGMLYTTSGGVTVDGDGNVVDWMEPSAYDILDLLEGPELTHKGDRIFWLLGLGLCAVTAGTVLFADELFRRNLRFHIRNVEDAEPSEWEIMSRYVGWTVLTIMALGTFIAGLTNVYV